MKKKKIDEVTWSGAMPDRRANDRRSVDSRRKMSGESTVLKVPDLTDSEDRRNRERRRSIKLIITGRAVEVSSRKDSDG